MYRIWSSVDAFFNLGDSLVEATTSSHPVTAKTGDYFFTDYDPDKAFIAGVVSVGTGIIFLSELSIEP